MERKAQGIKRIIDMGVFECFYYDEGKAIFPCAGKYILADIFAEKKADVIIDRIKLANNPSVAVWTEDKRHCLFVNTSGKGFVYDMTQKHEVCKLNFGLELFREQIAGTEKGFLFIDTEEDGTLYYFDAVTQEKTSINCGYKCRYLLDAGERILLFKVKKEGKERYFDILEILCIDKKNPTKISSIDISLPQGDVTRATKTFGGDIILSMNVPRGYGCQEVIFSLDFNNKKPNALFDTDCFIEAKDGYMCSFDADLKNNKVYIMTNRKLKVIDTKNKNILEEYDFEFGADVNRIDNYVIVSTWKGVFRFQA